MLKGLLVGACAGPLNRLGVNRLPFTWLGNLSATYHELCILATNSNDLEWCGKDLFILKNLGAGFHLGERFAAVNMETYFQVKDKIRFYREGTEIFADIEGLRFLLPFPSGVLELKETFLDGWYGEVGVEDSVVLDVGAFIGDSALFFALNGAKKVAAYEPAPPTLEFAKRNIALNRYENIIQVYGEAIGASEGAVKINYCSQMPGVTSQVWDNKEGINFDVKVKPLYSAVEELGHVDLLKLDCEGAEWSIIRDAADNGRLDEVDSIIMEVHGGSIFEMEKMLEKAQFKKVKRKFYTLAVWYLIASKKP